VSLLGIVGWWWMLPKLQELNWEALEAPAPHLQVAAAPPID